MVIYVTAFADKNILIIDRNNTSTCYSNYLHVPSLIHNCAPHHKLVRKPNHHLEKRQ